MCSHASDFGPDSTTIRWIAVKVCKHIHGPQRMKPNDSSSTMCLTFVVFHAMSQQQLNGFIHFYDTHFSNFHTM